MAEVPDWMDEEEAKEFLHAECDECGVENEGCECIACSECFEFGPGALTKDQSLTLCEDCADALGVEVVHWHEAIRHGENEFQKMYRKERGG